MLKALRIKESERQVGTKRPNNIKLPPEDLCIWFRRKKR